VATIVKRTSKDGSTSYQVKIRTKGAPPATATFERLYLRSKARKALVDENGIKGWIGMSCRQWQVFTGLTEKRINNNALPTLKKLGLIEQRRRKLSYNDPAALTWRRVSDEVTSRIEEIMDREPISAFEEITPPPSSSFQEITPQVTSSNGEELKEMDIIKNGNSKNVVIEETTKTDKQDIKIKKALGEEKKGSKGNKKEKYNTVIKEIYKGSPHLTPDPYKDSNANTLNDIMEYLDDNPSGFFQACSAAQYESVYALQQVVSNWGDFVPFAEIYNGAYNISLSKVK